MTRIADLPSVSRLILPDLVPAGLIYHQPEFCCNLDGAGLTIITKAMLTLNMIPSYAIFMTLVSICRVAYLGLHLRR